MLWNIELHLSPHFYDKLQNFVHKGHSSTLHLITRLLATRPGDTIVEFGCGTGQLAKRFIEHGYDYWGIEPDPERVEFARLKVPGAHFIIGDAQSSKNLDLPEFHQAFIHGVLHHLDDSQCVEILDGIISIRKDIRLVVIEPYKPESKWGNPIGSLMVKMDEGRYIRSLQGWQELFYPYMEHCELRSLWPRWPIPFISARLLT